MLTPQTCDLLKLVQRQVKFNTFTCHSEAQPKNLHAAHFASLSGVQRRFFTPLRSVQNDMSNLVRQSISLYVEKKSNDALLR